MLKLSDRCQQKSFHQKSW